MNKTIFLGKAWQCFNALQLSTRLATPLYVAYDEHWRTYHNVFHIIDMLDQAKHFLSQLSDENYLKLQFMILYHDVVYKIDRERGFNERASAARARKDLSSRGTLASPQFVDEVEQGILATINHSLTGVDERSTEIVAMLLDLDLHGLGLRPAQFFHANEKIWNELQPKFTREEFDAGRIIWAQKFLKDRPKIFHTRSFAHLESQAIKNLTDLAEGKLQA